MRECVVRRHAQCNAKKERYAQNADSKLKMKYYHIAYRMYEKLLNINLQLSNLLGIRPERLDGEGDIIVSLASYPPRINTAWMAIDSIMRGSVRPARVILNLSQVEFPSGDVESLPSSLKRYIPLGLEVRFHEEHLRSHNKYFHAIQENPSSIIITIDDDLYYPKTIIESLMAIHKEYPDAVCANRAMKITFDERGEYNTYKSWQRVIEPHAPSHLVTALGYGGILYPASQFTKGELFDPEAIKELCYTADDLWLKALEIKSGVKVAAGRQIPHPPEIRLSRRVSLQSINHVVIGEGERAKSVNDTQWDSVDKRYGIKELLKIAQSDESDS